MPIRQKWVCRVTVAGQNFTVLCPELFTTYELHQMKTHLVANPTHYCLECWVAY